MFHISVFRRTSEHVTNNLRFRQTLTADPVARAHYVALKRALAHAPPTTTMLATPKASLIAALLASGQSEATTT